MRRLEGRRAIVTGAGSGIGNSIAARLAAEGCSVAALDIREGAAQQTAKEIVDGGGHGIGVACDVGDVASVTTAVGEAASQLGGIDILVACAGIAFPLSTAECDIASWETILRVNLTGVFLSVREVLPHMLAAGRGSIVTIGSIASLVAAGNNSAYEASKGGVLQFTRAVAVEHAEAGIRANCVCPGLIQTTLAANTRALVPDAPPSERALIAERVRVPIGGRAAPSEIAAAVAFLCSDDASFITGIALPVDGGYTAI